jgi:oligopeptide transport system permease protein
MQEEIVKGTSLWQDAWKRLLKNKLAVFGLIVVVLMILTVFIGPILLEKVAGITPEGVPQDSALVKSFEPSLQHWMGTDDLGRDQFARVLQGGRISLMVGLISTIVSLLFGVSYGAIAGYFGGRLDNFMMRVVDGIYSIPYILVVIVLLSVFGGPGMPGFLKSAIDNGFYLVNYLIQSIVQVLELINVAGWFGLNSSETFVSPSSGIYQIFLLFFALGFVSWLTMARVVRGQILSLKNQEFVLAAKATGVSTFRIIFRHLVPNVLGVVIVYATLTIPSVMLTEAFLSFLGIGVQAPYASWGSLVADGIKNISIYPWQLIFPGVTMALTLFSLNFLGDGLRDAIDPQTRKF